MTLPSSGPISLSQVNVELGQSATASINMGSASVRSLFAVPSGAISMSDGYGKSNQFAFTISANQTNANLRTLAVNAGWNQSSKVVATISGGIYISSNSTGTPALTVSGSFPNGVELVNNGIIVGMGGNGGKAWDVNTGSSGTNGGAGGGALSVSSAITITNNGTIAGGGGGGGAGAYQAFSDPYVVQFFGGGGGGGGRSSNAANSSGGAGGQMSGGTERVSGSAGNSGTVSSAGSGGNPGVQAGSGGNSRGGYGGAGGGWGAAGTNGGAASRFGSTAYSYNATSAGSGGYAVSGNSNITWVATGTRNGSIS